MVMRDAIAWAGEEGADLLLVESAGLCSAAPLHDAGARSRRPLRNIGDEHALKMAAMLTLADIAVVTRIDLVSQAEKEVFRERIREVNPRLDIVETNALQGTGMRYLIRAIEDCPAITDPDAIVLRGAPPLGSAPSASGRPR